MPIDQEYDDPELVALAAPEKEKPKGPDLSIQLHDRTFTAIDLEKLSTDEYGRFMFASDKVGHALIHETPQGLQAQQFAYPATEVSVPHAYAKSADEPKRKIAFRPLHNFRYTHKAYGAASATYVRANTPGGTEMVAKRKVTIVKHDPDGSEKTYELHRFSPVSSHLKDGEFFWGACEDVKVVFRGDLSKEVKKDLESEQKEIKPRVIHEVWDIDRVSVLERKRRDHLPRVPTQGKVMADALKGGGQNYSAADIAADFIAQYRGELHPDRLMLLKRTAMPWINPITGKKQKICNLNYRGELGHARGHGLTKWGVDPQTANNLAAMPMYVNTQMMSDGERIAQWLLLNVGGTSARGEVKFNLLLDSPILEHGHMGYKVFKDGHAISLENTLRPMRRFAIFPKITDRSQTTMVAYALLTGARPISTHPVENSTGVKFMPFRLPPNPNRPTHVPPVTGGGHVSSSSSSSTKPARHASSSSSSAAVVRAKKTPAILKRADVSEKSFAKVYKHSVAKLNVTRDDPEQLDPWNAGVKEDTGGSGWFFVRDGGLYILTNAHVVRNQTKITIQMIGDERHYDAEPVENGIRYEFDLAVLRVTDAEFDQTRVCPLELGGMVEIEQEIVAIGFPIGGDNVRITKGTITRIQVADGDTVGGLQPLQADTDTSLNPGNSGCPMISGGKVVAMCYSGVMGANTLCYGLPVPHIKQCLDQVFGVVPLGIPTIHFDTDNLLNPYLRRYCGLEGEFAKQTGLLVTKVPKVSNAVDVLKEGDILCQIDGLDIRNDGKVNIPGIGDDLEWHYLIDRKAVGADVKMSVLRRNPTTKLLERKEVVVPLKYQLGDTTKLGRRLFDQRAPYFIHSGLVIRPVTHEYVIEGGGRLFKHLEDEEQKPLSEIPVEKIGQQIVVIDRILDCRDNQHYEDVSDVTIKTINGIEIDNFAQAIDAINNNTGPVHVVKTACGKLVVVKNMTAEEHRKVLIKNGIGSDRSPDLTEYLARVDPAKIGVPQYSKVAPPEVPYVVTGTTHSESLADLPTPTQPVLTDSEDDDVEDEDADLQDVTREEEEEAELDDEDEEEQLRAEMQDFIADDDEVAQELAEDPVALAKSILRASKAANRRGQAPRRTSFSVGHKEFDGGRGLGEMVADLAQRSIEESARTLRFSAAQTSSAPGRKRLVSAYESDEDFDAAAAAAAAPVHDAKRPRAESLQVESDEEQGMDDFPEPTQRPTW